MSLDTCKDCPANCFGNELDSSCVVHNGESLKGFLNNFPTTSDPIPDSNLELSSDDIISKSLIKNKTSICASKITNRKFSYTLSTSQSSTTFAWDFMDFIAKLPSNYQSSTVRVKVYGSTISGRNVIVDSQSPSAAVPIRVDQYPVVADFLIRVTSPCGDIDMESTITLANPASTGGFISYLSGQDLSTRSGEIVLTEHLNNIETQLSDLDNKVSNMKDSPDVEVVSLKQRVTNVESTLSAPSNFKINYVKDGGQKSDNLNIIINELYSRIKQLTDTIETQQIKIDSLESQINSL